MLLTHVDLIGDLSFPSPLFVQRFAAPYDPTLADVLMEYKVVDQVAS